MAHLPSLQTLRAFQAAGRLQSYTKAARELGLTHSAVSHRIRELEEQLGVTLFRRVGNTMALTTEGLQLFGKTTQGLSLLEDAFGAASAVATAKARSIVVSSVPSMASTWLYQRLVEFRALHPGIDVELRVSERLSDYKREKIDVGIRLGAGGWEGLNAVRLFDEALSPVCTPAYRDKLGLQAPADLQRATLLRNVWTPWVRWFRAAGLNWPEPTTGPMFDDSPLMLRSALDGQGVALGRHWLAVDELRAGRLVMPFKVTVRDDFQYWVVWPAGRTTNPDATLLREWLQAQAASENHPCPIDEACSTDPG